jgi:hypothetical protein
MVHRGRQGGCCHGCCKGGQLRITCTSSVL